MAKRKASPKKVTKCTCLYNHKISNMYTEAFEARVHDADDNEYTQALLHNDEFNMMADALADTECDHRMCLADAVRFGYEAGKRLAEIDALEKSVGY